MSALRGRRRERQARSSPKFLVSRPRSATVSTLGPRVEHSRAAAAATLPSFQPSAWHVRCACRCWCDGVRPRQHCDICQSSTRGVCARCEQHACYYRTHEQARPAHKETCGRSRGGPCSPGQDARGDSSATRYCKRSCRMQRLCSMHAHHERSALRSTLGGLQARFCQPEQRGTVARCSQTGGACRVALPRRLSCA